MKTGFEKLKLETVGTARELSKRENGITLIALVITIIVLLILARNFYSNASWG